ncbi:MAG: substrate-binding domain-containing protein [Lachnospiraceae bacterium]|nr:substrate-binding domain-containing protein [Lachnospiraceae bacterium]
MKKFIQAVIAILFILILSMGLTNRRPLVTFEKETPKTYQAKLDMIDPSSYKDIDELHLKKGSFISIIGQKSKGNFTDELKSGIKQATTDLNKKLGYKGKDVIKASYSGASGFDNIDDQVNILDEELSRNPVSLAISPIDEAAYQIQFDMAVDSDIPLISFDSSSIYKMVSADIETDNTSAAKTCANKLYKAINGKGTIGLFVHDSISESGRTREKVFLQTLKSLGFKGKIAFTYRRNEIATWQKAIAEKVNNGTYNLEDKKFVSKSNDKNNTDEENTSIITPDKITETDVINYLFAKYPKLSGIYTTNDDTTDLVMDEFDSFKNTNTKFVGFDITDSLLENIKDKNIVGTILQNPFGMGYATVIACSRAALDMGNQSKIDTGYVWVDKDNYKDKNIKELLY